MLRRLACVSILLIVGCSSSKSSSLDRASSSPTTTAQPIDSCDGNTLEIDACLQAKLDALDAQRADLMRSLTAEPPISIASQPPGDRGAAWAKADDAFLAYRDAVCQAVYLEHIQGTIRGPAFLSCEIDLTQRHLEVLRDPVNSPELESSS